METQSGIDEKTYRAIVSIVDRRMREIRVTRKDFDALKSAVIDLAEAQERTEHRLDRLSAAVQELAEAQKKTEERLDQLAQAQQRTEETLDRLSAKVEELAEAQKKTEERLDRLSAKVEELAEAQKKTEERLDRLSAKVEELAEAQKKTEERLDRLSAKVERLADSVETLTREMRNLARQVGALAENIGFGLEDIAHVVLPGYLYRHLGIEMGEFERRFLPVDGEDVEINLYAEGTLQGEKVTILGEVKSRIYAREVEAFQTTLAKVLPVVQGRVVKVMFGYFFRPEASELARKYDIIPVVSYQR